MSLIALTGCRSTPLLSYLRGLGILSILHKQCSSELLSFWKDSTLHINSDLARDAIQGFFLESYKPTPMLSPWNGGGGFRTLKCEKGERAVAKIESNDSSRFAPFRFAIEEARRAWGEGMASGWIEERWEKQVGKNDKYILKVDKSTFLARCRSLFPDEALDWLDATVVIADEKKPQYPLLLGTGGNLGRLDLATNYMEALSFLLDPRHRKRSAKLLSHSLFDEGHPRLDKKPVGQFSPGAAGTMNSSAFGSAESVENLWSFVLGLEGTLLFTSGIARRFGGSRGMATTPFTVPSSPAGYTSAEGENVKGEFWAPLWKRPLTVPELRRVIAEGRISWNGRHAAHGLDAAKALTTLGVDRGLGSFERYVIAERFGQSPLAVPVGTFDVAAQPADRVSLLGETDHWVNRVRRQSPPGAARSALRRIDAAQMEVVRKPDRPEPLQEFLTELASLEQTISRNPDLREGVGFPLPPLDTGRWAEALEDNTFEWRLAAAIATQADRPPGGRRLTEPEQRSGSASALLRPVKLHKDPWKPPEWADRPPDYLGSRTVIEGLAAAVVTRSMLSRTRQPQEDAPAVGSGSLVAFDHAGPLGPADLSAFLNNPLDGRRLRRLLSVASLLAYPPSFKADPGDQPRDISVARALLAPFYHARPVKVPSEDTGEQEKRYLLPSLTWPQKLRAGNVQAVLREAIVRLRAAGFSPAVRPRFIRVPSPDRLLASLLIPISPRTVEHAIRNVCPPRPSEGETK